MSKFKIFVVVFLVLIVVGGVITYNMWTKPNRSVENEKGISITAAQLVKEFQENENNANEKFLNKAIEVTGIVAELGNNQDGKSTITLSSDDAFTGVFCTLKENKDIASGATITIKGICSGMLTDVRLSEAVIVSK